MIEVERFILIGCLLQGALSRDWTVWMPQSIEALAGSCVLIPCTFDIHPDHDKNLVAVAKGEWKKRLESQVPLKVNFPTGVKINVQASPPKPKLTPDKVEVMEGTSMNLSCSAAAPCPKLPPNLTWTPSLNDSVDQLQENEDQTKSVSSILTFTASHLHHGQKITCRALYKLQQGDIQKTSNTSLTLTVLYMPQISGSGSCNRTAAEISCSCQSRGNPSPSMEWRVSGLRVTNSTDRVISEEQLGNTGLRSSLTMRHSQGDTPTLLCLSTNTVGSSSLRVHIPSPHQGFSINWLLIGAAAGAATMMIMCLIMQLILKKKRERRCSGSRMKNIKAVTDGSSPSRSPTEEDLVYSNHAMATTLPRTPDLGGTDPQTLPLAEGQIGEQLEGMHYASIKHSPQSVETQRQDGAAGRGADVVYSQVAVKRKTQKGKVEDGAGQEEERLVVGASMETESLCEEMEKKEMEGIPECEYSNVVFKKKDAQP
ncbi:hypothetical protein SKAU_G00418760 [Synaphobranchus kaupii]|uniref:Ig-like domain-containing protein n=1 Tax=Synaphobranchus kaupii TaxID=118154 RepID=A0A9Q1E6E9_SYNKA|nr:hypothetical protein SKAU_G00418760 [Synaphobranchus kaupii]